MRRHRTCLCATLVLGFTLALASTAFARHGLGLYGSADDKVVTNTGFLLIAFFPAFIAFMSFMQWKLDKRKDARKARASREKGRAGW